MLVLAEGLRSLIRWSPMRKLVGLSVLAVGVSLFGAPAFAQDSEEPPTERPAGEAAPYGNIELGVRVGFGFPAGKVGGAFGVANSDLSDNVDGILPFTIDAGYRFNDTVYLGLWGQYAFGFVNTDSNPICTQGIDCSVTDTRLGLNVHLHLAPGKPFDPWVGIGAGYEWFDVSASYGGASGDVTASGFEFVNFQLGGDIAATTNVALGPFLEVSLGEYRNLSMSDGFSTMDQSLTTKSIHAWIVVGLRAVFDPRAPR